MGGIVITQAAEYRPEKIKKLVYLTAFLLQNSEFLLQYAGQDETSAVTANLVVAEDHSCATVKAEALREAFYSDCSDEDAMMATSLLVPQSVVPLATPVSTSTHNFGRLPRVYISCLRDRAITPAIQKLMYSNLPCEQLIQMDTSHSPFLSAPEELAGHLLSL
jgi:pimeloyl-ACP methyl ester carboxylesterase